MTVAHNNGPSSPLLVFPQNTLSLLTLQSCLMTKHTETDMNEDIKRDAADTADKAVGKARQIAGKADEALVSLQDRIAEFRASATIDECIEQAKACIRQKPIKSVAVAFIAGCLLHAIRCHRNR